MGKSGIVTAAGLVAALVVLGSLPGLAKVTQYECRFAQEQRRGGGWIPEVVVLTENDQTGEIVVFDPVIKYFLGGPIQGKRIDGSNARTTYGWEVSTENRGQSARMLYRLTYFSNGQPAKMSARPGGYDNSWSGDGSCKVTSR
jgi:hypothetical protein